MAKWAVAAASGWALVLHILLMAALPGAQAAALAPGEAQLNAALQIICSAHLPAGPKDPSGGKADIHTNICVLCSIGHAGLTTSSPSIPAPPAKITRTRARLPPACGPPSPQIGKHARSRAPPAFA